MLWKTLAFNDRAHLCKLAYRPFAHAPAGIPLWTPVRLRAPFGFRKSESSTKRGNPLWNPGALERAFRVFALANHGQNGRAPFGIPTRIRACRAISQRRLPRQDKPCRCPFFLRRKRAGAQCQSLRPSAHPRVATNRSDTVRPERDHAREVAL